MRFNSPVFWVFLAIVAITLWALPKRVRKGWLLGVSYLFYASWSWPFVFLLFGCVAFTHVGAKWIDAAEGVQRRRRGWVIAGGNLALLFLFKYLDWTVDTANYLGKLLSFSEQWPLPHWLLPLGISFYVFEAISYTIDCVRKKERPQSFLDLQLFIVFFPHLIAGPIMRAKEFIPQLGEKWVLRYDRLVDGVWLVVSGLFVKIVLADGLGPQIDKGFAMAAKRLDAVDVVLLSLGFGIQIYLDFSSYTRIGLGAAKICGIDLVENFNYPFIARNPVDFWNRWHMSLSRWIRDYVFYPLAGGKVSLLNLCRATLIAMTLCGLWHGAAWKYVLWGFYHGLLICGYQIARFKFLPKPNEDVPEVPPWREAVGAVASIATLHLFLLPSWLLFRAENLQQAGQLLKRVGDGWSLKRALGGSFYLHVVVLFTLILLTPGAAKLWRRISSRIRGTLGIQSEFLPTAAWGCVAGMLFVLCLLYYHSKTTFIYFQF